MLESLTEKSIVDALRSRKVIMVAGVAALLPILTIFGIQQVAAVTTTSDITLPTEPNDFCTSSQSYATALSTSTSNTAGKIVIVTAWGRAANDGANDVAYLVATLYDGTTQRDTHTVQVRAADNYDSGFAESMATTSTNTMALKILSVDASPDSVCLVGAASQLHIVY